MKLILETLTPVHIGCGETIEPYEYVITDKFYRIYLEKFITSLSDKDRETFLKISSENMVLTRDFIRKKADLSLVTEYSLNVTGDVKEIYETKMLDPNNQLSIQTFIKTNSKPFIPGSSIKGAIRTAILYSMAEKPITFIEDIEKEVFKFKNPQNDPFRILKISDSLSLSFNDLKVYKVKTYTKKDKFTESGYNLIIEATNADYVDKSTQITHVMNIDSELKKYTDFIDIDFKTIINSCNEFCSDLIQSELKFYSNEEVIYIYEQLANLLKNLEKNSFMLRLGWGSGYDAVTINLARAKKEYKKSRRLIYSQFPLGWVKAKILE